jgi:hypothetical protein
MTRQSTEADWTAESVPSGTVLPEPTPLANANTRFSTLSDPCSSAELAAVLGKSPKTIVDWCQERAYTHIPCFRLGNRWYHRVPELIRWLNGIKSGHLKFRRKPRSSAKRRR